MSKRTRALHFGAYPHPAKPPIFRLFPKVSLREPNCLACASRCTHLNFDYAQFTEPLTRHLLESDMSRAVGNSARACNNIESEPVKERLNHGKRNEEKG